MIICAIVNLHTCWMFDVDRPMALHQGDQNDDCQICPCVMCPRYICIEGACLEYKVQALDRCMCNLAGVGITVLACHWLVCIIILYIMIYGIIAYWYIFYYIIIYILWYIIYLYILYNHIIYIYIYIIVIYIFIILLCFMFSCLIMSFWCINIISLTSILWICIVHGKRQKKTWFTSIKISFFEMWFD